MSTQPDVLAEAFRPAFYLRRLLRDRGGCRDVSNDSIPKEAPGHLVSSGSLIEEVFDVLDPVFFLLTLAGYDVPNVTVAMSPAWSTEHITLSTLGGACIRVAGDWRTLTGISLEKNAFLMVALRVLARRPFARLGTSTAIPLAPSAPSPGVASFRPWKDPTDPFADPRDGWIVLSTANIPGTLEITVQQMIHAGSPSVVASIRTRIIEEWTRVSVLPKPVCGLIPMLDPARWWAPQTDRASIEPIVALGRAVWDRLRSPAALEAFLAAPLDDPTTSAGTLLDDPMQSPSPVLEAMSALLLRTTLLHPADVFLPPFISQLERTHWVRALMQFHEYSLVRCLEAPSGSTPADPGVDLTGWYERVTPDLHYAIAPGDVRTLNLNQAGDQVSGWWYDKNLVRQDFRGSFDLLVWKTSGVIRIPALVITTASGTASIGILEYDANSSASYGWPVIRLQAGSSGGSWIPYVRDHGAAMLPPTRVLTACNAVGNASVEAHLPALHSVTCDNLEALADLLAGRLGSLRSGSNALQLDLDAEKHMRDACLGTQTGGKATVTGILLRTRREIRTRLGNRQAPGHPARNAWLALEAILGLFPNDTTRLQALLGLTPRPPHQYQYDMSGGGIEGDIGLGGHAGGGAFAITSTIEHASTCAPQGATQHGWSGRYWGRLGQGELGVTLGEFAGVHFLFTASANDLFTSDEWIPDDFLCPFFGAEVSRDLALGAGVAASGGKDYEGFSFVRLRDGAIASGSGTGEFYKVGAGEGMGATGSAGVYAGFFSSRGSLTSTQSPQPPPQVTPTVSSADLAEVHFAVNAATLNDSGLFALARMIAENRALFEDPSAFLEISGDASPTGTETYNADLSRRRAVAVYQAIRGLLQFKGSTGTITAFAIPEERTRLVAYGEQRALTEVPDGTESAIWRKVTVFVSGQWVGIL